MNFHGEASLFQKLSFIFNNRYILYLFSIHFGGRVIFRRATDDGRKSIVKERDLARIREKQME